MRAADHHPDLVHNRNGPAAEIGEAARILVETSTRCRVGLVIGKKHPANAEIIVKRNEIDSLVERVHALDVEADRSEEHTSELQSLMRISYAVFCLKKKSTTSK